MVKRLFVFVITVIMALMLTASTAFAGEVVTDPEEPEAPDVATGSGITVNLSEESIQAIADALNDEQTYIYQYQYPISFEYKGSTYWFIFDTDEADFMSMPIFVFHDWYTVYAYIGECNFYLRNTNNYGFIDAKRARVSLTKFATNNYQVYSFETLNDLEVMNGNTAISVLWSNYHVFDSKTGQLLFEATYLESSVFVVSFNTGFEDLTISSQTSDTLEPPQPSKDGFVFLGWYLDADCTQLYTADYEFTADTTLYAKWSEAPVGTLGPMAFFAGTLFESLSLLLDSAPIFYLVSLMGLALIIGIIITLCKYRV